MFAQKSQGLTQSREFNPRTGDLAPGTIQIWKELVLALGTFLIGEVGVFFSLRCWLSVSHGHSMPQAWGYFCSSGQKPLGSGQCSYFTQQLCFAMSSSPTALCFWQFACSMLCLFFYHVKNLQKLIVGIEATMSQAMAVPMWSLAPWCPAWSICDMLRISPDIRATILASEVENDSHNRLVFHCQAGWNGSSCSFCKCFLSSHYRPGSLWGPGDLEVPSYSVM